jgi:superkiller protein 8
LKDANPLGCHHLATSRDGTKAVSVGFGGETNIWRYGEGMWIPEGELREEIGENENEKTRKKSKVGETWAVAISDDGKFLAGTSYDGRIGVWDLLIEPRRKIREYETKGSFGLCVALVRDTLARLLASILDYPLTRFII